MEIYRGNPGLLATKKEILALGTVGYLPEVKELKSLKKFLVQKLEVSEEEDIYLQNPAQIKQMVELVDALWNNTKMLLNRGFTPNELSAMSRNKPYAVPLAATGAPSNIISFEEARKNKIYPNAICPCGSGKKYKNCCRGK